jgi:hypothetical protein
MDMMKKRRVPVLKSSFYSPAPAMMKNESMRERAHNDSITYLSDLKRVQNVIADLVSEKIISKPADVKWFGLSETELIVNGQKQPDALQQKLKAKYGIHQNYGLYYGPVEMTGTGVFIDVEARENFQRFNLQRLKLQRDQIILNRSKELWSKEQKPKLKQGHWKMLQDDQHGFDRAGVSLQPMIANVIDDLVSENIVKDKSDLSSFKLTNTFLLVNGKKQPDDIHEKLKTKYLTHPRYPLDGPGIANDPHFGLHYDMKNGSMGIGVSVDRDDP